MTFNLMAWRSIRGAERGNDDLFISCPIRKRVFYEASRHNDYVRKFEFLCFPF